MFCFKRAPDNLETFSNDRQALTKLFFIQSRRLKEENILFLKQEWLLECTSSNAPLHNKVLYQD